MQVVQVVQVRVGSPQRCRLACSIRCSLRRRWLLRVAVLVAVRCCVTAVRVRVCVCADAVVQEVQVQRVAQAVVGPCCLGVGCWLVLAGAGCLGLQLTPMGFQVRTLVVGGLLLTASPGWCVRSLR